MKDISIIRVRQNLLYLFISISVLASASFFIKSVYEIQIDDYELYQKSTQSYRVETQTLYALRGTIFDRNGEPIAMTINSFELGVHPERVKGKVEELAGLLKNFVNKDKQDIYDLLISNKKFVYIDRNLSIEKTDFLKEVLEDYEGVVFSRTFDRVNLISQTEHFIGIVDRDNKGIEGIELVYHDHLDGEDGYRTFEATENGSRIPQGKTTTIQPRHGKDLYLTIDSDLQFEASNQCQIAIKETGAERCSIVLMNGKTGEIYALVEEGESDILNVNLISVRGQYEPGSALKIFTVGSVLESKKTTVNTTFFVEDEIAKMQNACMDWYDGEKGCFRDFLPHDDEELMVKEIIEESSNVGTIKVVDLSDINEVEKFLRKFGFGSKTGIEVTGELRGRIQPDKRCSTCLASLAIGYSIDTTQIQMVKAYAIIANGGNNVYPTLVKTSNEDTQDGEVVIDKELADELKMLLINVVNGENGTARSIKKEGLVIGGKTGTSKSFIEDQNYAEKKYNTSFTGFFETPDGPIVGSVILWHAINSQYSEYVTGGSTAAPIFGELVESIVKRNILDGK